MIQMANQDGVESLVLLLDDFSRLIEELTKERKKTSSSVKQSKCKVKKWAFVNRNANPQNNGGLQTHQTLLVSTMRKESAKSLNQFFILLIII